MQFDKDQLFKNNFMDYNSYDDNSFGKYFINLSKPNFI